jgi:hypothetical protein
MQLEVREIISLGAGLLVLAGLSIAIVNGDKTANILGTGTSGFANLIKAATLKG